MRIQFSFLKACEDPNVWISKKGNGNLPNLLVDKNSVYCIVGKRILFKTEVENLAEAVVGFMATFYLFDYEYPKSTEMAMNVLQVLIFLDTEIPEYIAGPVNGMLEDYRSYTAKC